MKMIQIFVEGSGWHELPADTPPEKINEYVTYVTELVAACPPPVAPKTNGKASHIDTAHMAIKFLAGEM